MKKGWSVFVQKNKRFPKDILLITEYISEGDTIELDFICIQMGHPRIFS
jgi:hypothetical protein